MNVLERVLPIQRSLSVLSRWKKVQLALTLLLSASSTRSWAASFVLHHVTSHHVTPTLIIDVWKYNGNIGTIFSVLCQFYGTKCHISLCYEHDVCLSVCDVGGLWSGSATKSENGHMTEKVGVLATCMPKPSIIAACDLGYKIMWSFALRLHSSSNGSHAALSQHLLSFLFHT